MPTPDHKLTRAEMEAVLKNGGSVLFYPNRIITQIEHLPSEADLAAGDPDAQKEVAAGLQKQIDDLKQQQKVLNAQIAQANAQNAAVDQNAKADQTPQNEQPPSS